MNVDSLISELKDERERIDKAIAALEALNSDSVVPAPPTKRKYTRRAPLAAQKTPAKRTKSRKGKKWSPEQRAKFMKTMGYANNKKPHLAKAA